MRTLFPLVFALFHLHFSSGKCPPKQPFNAIDDARAIANEKASTEVLITTFGCRPFAERKLINAEYQTITGNSLDRNIDKWLQIFYQNPEKQPKADPFLDCIDAMVDSAEKAFIRFLEGAFYSSWGLEISFRMVTQILVANDDTKGALVDNYNKYALERISETVNTLTDEIDFAFPACDYTNFLRSLASKMREPDPPSDIDPKLVEEQVDRVLKEKNDKGWDDHRQDLEENLMIKSIKFAQLFLKKYQEKNNGIPIEQDIEKDLGHNKQLTFGYLSLVQKIHSRTEYIETRIRDSAEEPDRDGTWTVLIVGLSEQPIFNDIKAAFNEAYAISLQNFILYAKHDNPLYQMLAELTGADPPPPVA